PTVSAERCLYALLSFLPPSRIALFLLSLPFFCNDTATTEIYTLSLHDALPISAGRRHTADAGGSARADPRAYRLSPRAERSGAGDRKSTRLNSSHQIISYAVFCLKKKNRESTRSTLSMPNKN